MSAAEQHGAAIRTVDPKLIYVVDDEPMIGDVVQIVLKMGGYEPRFFQNPEAALQALIDSDTIPALLLTDYVMSPINGMELIALSKNHYPDLRTILYSGNAGEDMLQHYAARPDAFLRKPFLPRVLLGLVQSTLTGSTKAAAA
jgi:DNA-binding NtrC family response regulator